MTQVAGSPQAGRRIVSGTAAPPVASPSTLIRSVWQTVSRRITAPVTSSGTIWEQEESAPILLEQDPWDLQITPIRWPLSPVTTLTIILTLIMFPIMPRESSQRRRWPRWWRMTRPACWMSTRGPSPCSTPSGAWCSPPQTSPSRGTGSCSPAEISGDFQTLPRVSGQIRTAGSSQGLGKLKNSFIMFLLYNSHQRLTCSYSNYQYIKGWMMMCVCMDCYGLTQ